MRYLAKSVFLASQRRLGRLRYRLGGTNRRNLAYSHVLLTYHTLCQRESIPSCLQGETVRIHDFEDHLQRLLSSDYRLVTVSEMISQPPTGKIAAITFDDGYASVCRYAFPLLEKYQAKATLFLTVGFISGEVQPPWGIEDGRLRRAFSQTAPLWRPCTWEEVQKMSRSPLIEIGSHGQSHRLLGRIPVEESFGEMTASKQELENRIQKEIHVFSYPFGIGRYGAYRRESGIELHRAGYLAACTGEEGPFHGEQDRFFLPRYPVRYADTGIDVLCRITGRSSPIGSFQIIFHRCFPGPHGH